MSATLRKVVLMSLIVVISACSKQTPSTQSTPAPAVPVTTATVVYFNGDIVTVNTALPSAEAVAVRDGRILAVGSLDSVLESI